MSRDADTYTEKEKWIDRERDALEIENQGL